MKCHRHMTYDQAILIAMDNVRNMIMDKTRIGIQTNVGWYPPVFLTKEDNIKNLNAAIRRLNILLTLGQEEWDRHVKQGERLC